MTFKFMENIIICEMCVSESWTVIEAGVPTTERNPVPLAGLSAGKYAINCCV